MKEIRKKDLPGISGGQVDPIHGVDSTPVAQAPGYPQAPGASIGPTDPYDPLWEGPLHKQV